MPTYVSVAVNLSQVGDVFDYHLPPELEGAVQPGHLVEVPFGNRRVQGVVFGLVDQPAVTETRPVLALLDPLPVLTAAQRALAEALAEASLAPLAACINLMLPTGLGQQADVLYTLQAARLPAGGAPFTSLQQRILAQLTERGPLRGRQLDAAFRRVDWRASMRRLVRQELVTTQPVLPAPSVQPKTVRTASLACPPEQAQAAAHARGRQHLDAGDPAGGKVPDRAAAHQRQPLGDLLTAGPERGAAPEIDHQRARHLAMRLEIEADHFVRRQPAEFHRRRRRQQARIGGEQIAPRRQHVAPAALRRPGGPRAYMLAVERREQRVAFGVGASLPSRVVARRRPPIDVQPVFHREILEVAEPGIDLGQRLIGMEAGARAGLAGETGAFGRLHDQPR
ncbi:MAG: hypothetical protein R6W76_05955, partial [Caldilinea sp.]